MQFSSRFMRFLVCLSAMLWITAGPAASTWATVASADAWASSGFRIWGFVPYWADPSIFPADGIYPHVSDVLYFGGVRPKIDGSLYTISGATTQINTLKSHATTYGFRLHMSMFEVYDPASSNDYDLVWNTIGASPSLRATFVNNVKNLLQTNNMKGFNFDYERPSTDTQWANYTQLAKDMRAVINPLGMEVSVDDFGSTDSDWDDTSTFDARTYDQLFIMGYHYGASSNASFANGKLALTAQGAEKAFKNEQLVLGVGTWGSGPTTKTLKSIVAATPNLAYNAETWTDGTNTWEIESREQVRAKTQLALDRNMPGMMSWTMHYDATGTMSLHRVMHHYAMVKREAPDLNLDGKINATDATIMANNQGMARTNTGMATAAEFDAYYLAANWENGDRDGNGFVNQADADWLAGRYNTLGITLPDRLAYSGTFESFTNAVGVNGRWRAARDAQNKLIETGNFKQEATNYLSWTGTGAGASQRSNSFVTMRYQNAAEVTAGVNAQTRSMNADLSQPIDLAQNQETYFTFLVRENTGSLSGSQLASPNRKLTLDFLDGTGATQFNVGVLGLQQTVSLNHVADAAGQDVISAGFAPNTTYLLVGKISGNGAAANTLQVSFFGTGSLVANFTDPSFNWMLTATSGVGFNPLITDVQFSSSNQTNFTVSNLWIGTAAAILPPTLTSQGDFNQDGTVDGADYVFWRSTLGQTGAGLLADGNGDLQVTSADLATWRSHFGASVSNGSGLLSGTTIPEPNTLAALVVSFLLLVSTGQRWYRPLLRR
ncbi:MAG: hypothetical protein IT425_08710 [Pirellulales bacterium]|nr:hypothetical protein [Pirellulales bacterium]